MSIPIFVMLIGLPGSGKSRLAEDYRALGYSVHSSDDIREELSGDVNNQKINTLVFDTLHSRIKEDLKNQKNCVYDATNISYKRRKAFLNEIKKYFCYKRAVLVATPYEVCLEQNELRERKVPEEVIERMYKNFDPPHYYEGWNEILIHYNYPEYRTLYKTPAQFIFDTIDYNQDNRYHTETLGEHCRLTTSYVIEHCPEDSRTSPICLAEAASLHDNGKPFCKTFKDARGKPCDSAHYYSHEHVGAYNAFFYDVSATDRLYISVLIRWHMQMHFIDKQPHTQEKYKQLLGNTLWNDLSLLHKGDLEAHNNIESKE